MKRKSFSLLLALALLLAACGDNPPASSPSAEPSEEDHASQSSQAEEAPPAARSALTAAEEKTLASRPDPIPIDPATYIPHFEAMRGLQKGYYIVGPYHEERAYISVCGNAFYGYADSTGKVAVPITLECSDFLPHYGFQEYSEGRAGFYASGGGEELLGYMDAAGKEVIPNVFTFGGKFIGGIAPVEYPDGETRYIGRDGNAVANWEVGCALSVVDYAQEGLYPIRVEGGEGFMTADGAVAIQPAYQAVQPFSEGLAAVQDADGLWGYIDTTGSLVIAPQFYAVRSFKEGVAAVVTTKTVKDSGFTEDKLDWQIEDGHIPYSYIDRTGKLLLQEAATTPIWPGAATPAPTGLDCKNSSIAGSGYVIGMSNALYNKGGKPLRIAEDCPAGLQDYEKPYVRAWNVTYQDGYEFLYKKSSSGGSGTSGTLKLYEDRTALLVDAETGALLQSGLWMARYGEQDTVYLQAPDGKLGAALFMDYESELFGVVHEEKYKDLSSLPLKEAVARPWSSSWYDKAADTRFLFAQDGTFLYADWDAEWFYSMGSWRIEGEEIFLSASCTAELQNGVYLRQEIPPGERITESYPVFVQHGYLHIGEDQLSTIGEPGDVSSLVDARFADLYRFRDNDPAFQLMLDGWNASQRATGP